MYSCLIVVHYETLFQGQQKPVDKPAIEENAFDALERDFQEVCKLHSLSETSYRKNENSQLNVFC